MACERHNGVTLRAQKLSVDMDVIKHGGDLQIIDANLASTKLGCEGNQQSRRRVRLDKSI